MADTVRTLASLLSLLADNTTGAISAQDLRDAIVSIMGVYGGLYIDDGTTGTAVGTSYVTLDWADGGNFGENNADADYTNDKVTIGTGGDGVYLVIFKCSATGTASATFKLRLSVNGTEDAKLCCEVLYDASGSLQQMGFCGLVTLAAADIVTIEVIADGASKTFTPKQAQLVLRRIA